MAAEKSTDGRMTWIVVLAIVILAISLYVLMSMETSLEEGRGPQGEAPFAILPLMALIVVLIILMSTQIRSRPTQFTTDHVRTTALMAAMFITGMLIEPALPRTGYSPGDAFGAIFILIPVLLIAAMVVPMIPNRSDEEE